MIKIVEDIGYISEIDPIEDDTLTDPIEDGTFSEEDEPYDWYFGKEEFEEYGDLVSRKLSGQTISKAIAKGDQPGGLKYEAEKLGINLYTLLKAIEGLCYNGLAYEIDDSTYLIK